MNAVLTVAGIAGLCSTVAGFASLARYHFLESTPTQAEGSSGPKTPARLQSRIVQAKSQEESFSPCGRAGW